MRASYCSISSLHVACGRSKHTGRYTRCALPVSLCDCVYVRVCVCVCVRAWVCACVRGWKGGGLACCTSHLKVFLLLPERVVQLEQMAQLCNQRLHKGRRTTTVSGNPNKPHTAVSQKQRAAGGRTETKTEAEAESKVRKQVLAHACTHTYTHTHIHTERAGGQP